MLPSDGSWTFEASWRTVAIYLIGWVCSIVATALLTVRAIRHRRR